MAGAAPPAPAKPLCFVIGPIGARGSETRKHADWLLKGIIRPPLEDPEFGYRVKRADDEPRPGMISDAMIHDIINADLAVADLTDLNPNAFYELGIRHAAIKPVIHIARAGTVPPFDNAGHGVIFVDIGDVDNVEAVKNQLADAARAIKASDFRVSNPITLANASFRMRESADPTERVLAEVLARVEKIESDLRPRQAIQTDSVAQLVGASELLAEVERVRNRAAANRILGNYRAASPAPIPDGDHQF